MLDDEKLELAKLMREYEELAARVKRGTSTNIVLDLQRLKELAAKIEKLLNGHAAD